MNNPETMNTAHTTETMDNPDATLAAAIDSPVTDRIAKLQLLKQWAREQMDELDKEQRSMPSPRTRDEKPEWRKQRAVLAREWLRLRSMAGHIETLLRREREALLGLQ